MYEPLERRRLLSADTFAPAEVEPDLPIAEDTSDVLITDGRQQIYPPLAPAMWVDEAVGSFEEPAEITVAFFPADPIDETPAPDDREPEPIAPPVADATDDASIGAVRPRSIARELLGGEDDATPTV